MNEQGTPGDEREQRLKRYRLIALNVVGVVVAVIVFAVLKEWERA